MYGEKHPQELKNNCSEALDEKSVKNNCSEPILDEKKPLTTTADIVADAHDVTVFSYIGIVQRLNAFQRFCYTN